MSDEPKKKYGCLMAVIPAAFAAALIDWVQKTIPPEHLAEEGIEDFSHVTIKHGFTDDSPELVKAISKVVVPYGPLVFKLGGLSLFEGNEDGDVLKIDVSSSPLHGLNSVISQNFDCHDKYPEYKPHLTLAYLKPGAGKLYTRLKPFFVGQKVVVREVEYSSPTKDKTRINLATSPGEKSMNGKKSLSYRKKNANRDRERILSSLGEGDPTAIHALHDWHQDNPGHEQEQDVAHLRDYVNTDQEQQGESHADFEGHTAEQRAGSAHAHLTGKIPSAGDLVRARHYGIYRMGTAYANPGYTGIHRGSVGASDAGYPLHSIRFTDRNGVYSTANHYGDELTHHATHWLNQRKQQEQQNQSGKALVTSSPFIGRKALVPHVGKGMTSSDPNSRKIQDDMDAEDESIEQSRLNMPSPYGSPEWMRRYRENNQRENRLARAEQEGHHDIRGEYDTDRMENIHGPVQRRENNWYDYDQHTPQRGVYRTTREQNAQEDQKGIKMAYDPKRDKVEEVLDAERIRLNRHAAAPSLLPPGTRRMLPNEIVEAHDDVVRARNEYRENPIQSQEDQKGFPPGSDKIRNWDDLEAADNQLGDAWQQNNEGPYNEQREAELNAMTDHTLRSRQRMLRHDERQRERARRAEQGDYDEDRSPDESDNAAKGMKSHNYTHGSSVSRQVEAGEGGYPRTFDQYGRDALHRHRNVTEPIQEEAEDDEAVGRADADYLDRMADRNERLRQAQRGLAADLANNRLARQDEVQQHYAEARRPKIPPVRVPVPEEGQKAIDSEALQRPSIPKRRVRIYPGGDNEPFETDVSKMTMDTVQHRYGHVPGFRFEFLDEGEKTNTKSLRALYRKKTLSAYQAGRGAELIAPPQQKPIVPLKRNTKATGPEEYYGQGWLVSPQEALVVVPPEKGKTSDAYRSVPGHRRHGRYIENEIESRRLREQGKSVDPKTVRVRISDLVRDEQNRKEAVQNLRRGQSSQTEGPVKLYRREGSDAYELGDGYHRTAEAEERGDEYIEGFVAPEVLPRRNQKALSREEQLHNATQRRNVADLRGLHASMDSINDPAGGLRDTRQNIASNEDMNMEAHEADIRRLRRGKFLFAGRKALIVPIVKPSPFLTKYGTKGSPRGPYNHPISEEEENRVRRVVHLNAQTDRQWMDQGRQSVWTADEYEVYGQLPPQQGGGRQEKAIPRESYSHHEKYENNPTYDQYGRSLRERDRDIHSAINEDAADYDALPVRGQQHDRGRSDIRRRRVAAYEHFWSDINSEHDSAETQRLRREALQRRVPLDPETDEKGMKVRNWSELSDASDRVSDAEEQALDDSQAMERVHRDWDRIREYERKLNRGEHRKWRRQQEQEETNLRNQGTDEKGMKPDYGDPESVREYEDYRGLQALNRVADAGGFGNVGATERYLADVSRNANTFNHHEKVERKRREQNQQNQ